MKFLKIWCLHLTFQIFTSYGNAQDYSLDLGDILKVIVRSETNIILKAHDEHKLLIKSSENTRNEATKNPEGLKMISGNGEDNTNYGVEVQKAGKVLMVTGLRDRTASQLIIHLSKGVDISVESLANNDIHVDGFISEIEAVNYLGSIVLENVTGPIVAENGNGDITIIFSELNQESPTSVATSNGDIHIRMPATSSSSITSKMMRGHFYSDFDLIQDIKTKPTRSRNTIRGELNGGGVTMNLHNLKGDIYLKKIE